MEDDHSNHRSMERPRQIRMSRMANPWLKVHSVLGRSDGLSDSKGPGKSYWKNGSNYEWLRMTVVAKNS